MHLENWFFLLFFHSTLLSSTQLDDRTIRSLVSGRKGENVGSGNQACGTMSKESS